MERTNKILLAAVFVLSALLVASNIDDVQDITGMLTTGAGSEATTEIVDVDLFAMSMCSHCIDLEASFRRVYDEIGDNIRFRMFFVMKRGDNGIPSSPRGYPEDVENARQLCIYHHFPDSLFEYLSCISPHHADPGHAWEACASNSCIDVDAVRSCWDGEEGRELLWHNTFMAEYLGITSAPRLLINDEMYTGKRNSNSLLEAICREFRDPPEACYKNLESTGLTGLLIGAPSEGFCSLD